MWCGQVLLTRRGLYIIVLFLSIIAAIVYGFLPSPIAIDVVTVKRAPLKVVLEEEGKTRLTERFTISAPVAGTMQRVNWDVGDKVIAGQIVCEISPLQSTLLDARSKTLAEDRVSEATATLRNAKARLLADIANAEFAESEYQRIEQIFNKKLLSRSALDRASSEKDRTTATVNAARHAVEAARYALSEARNTLQHYVNAQQNQKPDKQQNLLVHSPIDGAILSIASKSESAVIAGQRLMEIGDTQALEVEVEVLSVDAVAIHPGMATEFKRWGGEQVLHGRVRIVEPTGFTKVSALGVEEQRVRVIVDFTSPHHQWQRLGDGYRVDTRFILWQQEDVLQVPSNALFRDGDGWGVFVIDSEHTAQIRPVTPGKRSGLSAQIVEGLQEGELVISHPGEEVKAGVQVELSPKN